MTVQPGRRTFLIAIGGGLASAALAAGLWRARPWAAANVDHAPIAPCCELAHYNSWLVTPADIQKLSRAAQ